MVHFTVASKDTIYENWKNVLLLYPSTTDRNGQSLDSVVFNMSYTL